MPALEEAPDAKRTIPSLAEFQAIVADIRSLPLTVSQTRHAEDTANFLEFLGLARLGQAETSSLTWGDVNRTKIQAMFLTRSGSSSRRT